MAREITIGIGGAAGDGLDKTGDALAKTASRLGVYIYAYNSYQSVIRGGHIWLRVRLGAQKLYDYQKLFVLPSVTVPVPSTLPSLTHWTAPPSRPTCQQVFGSAPY